MKLLDVVVTLRDFPGVPKGQAGTVVEELADNSVLVEFADSDGVAYAILPIPLAMLAELKQTPGSGTY
jgi:hypothetical protein